MTSEQHSSINCPSCNSVIKFEIHSSGIQCKVCNTDFSLSGHLCPSCSTYHQLETALCLNCGVPLTKTCRKCATVNWSGLEKCVNCGASIDIFAMVSESGDKSTTDRLQRQMSQAQAIKMTEEMASNKRMAELLAIEEARQAEIRQQMAKQKEQEKKLLITVFGAIALFLLLLIAYAIISTIL